MIGQPKRLISSQPAKRATSLPHPSRFSDEEVGIFATQQIAAVVATELVRVVGVVTARRMDIHEVPYQRDVGEDATAATDRKQLIGLPCAAVDDIGGLMT